MRQERDLEARKEPRGEMKYAAFGEILPLEMFMAPFLSPPSPHPLSPPHLPPYSSFAFFFSLSPPHLLSLSFSLFFLSTEIQIYCRHFGNTCCLLP